MSRKAALFERAWSGTSGGWARQALTRGDGEIEPVREELRLAEGLRGIGSSVDQPDWDAAWEELAQDLRRPVVVQARQGRPSGSKRLARVAVALAAALFMVAGTVIGAAGAAPGSLLYPVRKAVERGFLVVSPSDRGLLVKIANARLEDLLGALRDGHFELAADLARDLMQARQAALEAGGDVTTLDADIAGRVPPALAGAPPSVRSSVTAILGWLLPPHSLEVGGGSSPSGSDPAGTLLSGSGPTNGTDRAGRARHEGEGEADHDQDGGGGDGPGDGDADGPGPGGGDGDGPEGPGDGVGDGPEGPGDGEGDGPGGGEGEEREWPGDGDGEEREWPGEGDGPWDGERPGDGEGPGGD